MNFLTVLFPSEDKPGFGSILAGVLPYFLRPKPRGSQREVFLSLDTIRAQSELWHERHGSQYIAFTFSAIALAAKLVQIDGEANEAEVTAFYSHFPMPGGNQERGAELFYEAYIDTADTRLYAKKITSFYPDNKPLYIQLVQALIKLAFADAPMNTLEYTLIRKITVIFDISDAEFKQLLREYIIPSGSDPYALLGTRRRSTHDQIRKAYRDAIRDCHPDIFGRYDLPQEVKSVMVEKFKRLTNAYEAIRKFRQFDVQA